MKTLKEGTREERVALLKKVLKFAGGNLVLDGAYYQRIDSMIKMHGLEEELKLSEVKEIIMEAHNAEVLSIAEWSLQFEDDTVREIKIMNEVVEALDGDFNYTVATKISKLAYSLLNK